MVFVRRMFVIIVALVSMLVISACGSTPPATSGGSTTGSSSQNNSTGNGYGSASKATPTTAASTAGNVVVQTAQATVEGKTMTILTDTKGMTLYYFTPDTAAKTACTGACLQNWPALLFTGSGTTVSASTKLPGELEVYKNANGNQVVYQNHPLYTFAGDSAPGQVNGQGKGGKWFVATPDLPANK